MSKKLLPLKTDLSPGVDFVALESDKKLPLLVLPNIVLFPENTIPLASAHGLRPDDFQAMQKGGLRIGVVTHLGEDAARREQIAPVGTEAIVAGLLKLPNGEIGALLKGTRRFVIQQIVKRREGFEGKVLIADDKAFKRTDRFLATFKALKNLVLKLLKLSPNLAQEAVALLYTTDDPGVLCDVITPHLSSLTTREKIAVLGNFDLPSRVEKVLKALSKEVELLEISTRIQEEVKNDIHNNLRRSFLREQMHAIKRELGELGGEVDEITKLKEELDTLVLPKEVGEAAEREFERLSMMHPGLPEYMVSWTYLGWIKDLPWPKKRGEKEKIQVNLEKASKILAENHYGLDKVKERIMEYIAVIQHRGALDGQVLLLVGPPGVGKTSLGRSIAKAFNRPLVRVSLGGVKDEAEIRGHRRTYIGSMPGKVIQAMKEARVSNPVVLLDEIDKASGASAIGDVSAALLEVLDREQNKGFIDHYLGVPFDLSQVLFIATANTTRTISSPLLDRMEVIELSGYTEKEKIKIAGSHLVPKIRKELTLSARQLNVSEEVARLVVRHYTREAGVRQLYRQLSTIGRKIVRKIVEGPEEKSDLKVKSDQIVRYLGVPRYVDEPNDKKLPAGVAVGLAYTAFGGDILYIESRKSVASEGRGRLMMTGSLGKVMQESAQTVLSFLLSNAELFNLSRQDMEKSHIHIHLPDGATPKDGPSAGVAILCTIASLFLDKALPVSLAMTGEITLRGQVLAVGGIKEKLIAAHRYGRKHIIMPAANWLDLEELPEDVLRDLHLYPVRDMTEALCVAKLVSPTQGKKSRSSVKYTRGGKVPLVSHVSDFEYIN